MNARIALTRLVVWGCVAGCGLCFGDDAQGRRVRVPLRGSRVQRSSELMDVKSWGSTPAMQSRAHLFFSAASNASVDPSSVVSHVVPAVPGRGAQGDRTTQSSAVSTRPAANVVPPAPIRSAPANGTALQQHDSSVSPAQGDSSSPPAPVPRPVRGATNSKP